MIELLNYAVNLLSVPGRDVFEILFSLILSAMIATIISQIYKFTHRGLSYELSFMTTLVLLSPIVAVVMLFIRGDLVLSLGLIGSLSIIRFRTPIKDTRDMVFIFWVIAVGLGSGTYNWVVVILSTMVIATIMVSLHLVRYGHSTKVDYVLVLSGVKDYDSAQIRRVLKQYTKEADGRSKELNGDFWEAIFEVRFDKREEDMADQLVGALKELPGVEKVALLAPQVALPV